MIRFSVVLVQDPGLPCNATTSCRHVQTGRMCGSRLPPDRALPFSISAISMAVNAVRAGQRRWSKPAL